MQSPFDKFRTSQGLVDPNSTSPESWVISGVTAVCPIDFGREIEYGIR